MSKVIMFSRVFPAYHPRKGQSTHFVEKIWTDLFRQNIIDNRHIDDPLLELEAKNVYTKSYSPKTHTIRSGNRWKVGDWFSPRVWSGKPYQTKQIIIAPDIEVKKVWDFEFTHALFIDESAIKIDNDFVSGQQIIELCTNDGLEIYDFFNWFSEGKSMSSNRKIFKGQIICWNDNIEY